MGEYLGMSVCTSILLRNMFVYEPLDDYLKATENLRNSTRLLVSYIKPYRAVTSSTIGRWIKTMLG